MTTTTSTNDSTGADAPTASTTTNDEENKHTRDFKDKSQTNQSSSSLGLGTKSWRSLMEVSMARSRKIRGSNYVQLATVDLASQEPRCRTVVFRGFQRIPDDYKAASSVQCDDLSTIMKMCTDARSKKVHESTMGEIVWWFPKSNEQYRLRGKLLYVGGDGDNDDDGDKAIWKHARKELWGNLSDAARESFFDPNIPGQPVQSAEEEGSSESTPSKIPVGGRDEETGKPLPPPDCFLLMLLFPHHVDYLNLKENYRQIDVLDSDKKEWSFQTVNA